MTDAIRILGIDPGSQVTGYGVVELVGALVAEHEPHEIAIERVFVSRNADSALKLGQARAAAICATFDREIPIHEYAPREIKKAVVASGAAEKSQVVHMVKVLLGLRGSIQADAADALAVALCHSQVRLMKGLVARAQSA